MDTKIFDRVEKKYLITSEQKAKILREAGKKLSEDRYYLSEVFNIYFDTDNFDLIIKSIENPNFKEKLRARSYGGYDKVFMEVKTKLLPWEPQETRQKIGYKRRVLITHADYEELVSGKKTTEELARQKVETPIDAQIAREVDYLMQHFNLKPQILVYYKRESYLGNDRLRITFDEDLAFRERDLKFTRAPSDQRYFNDEQNIIMEIKAHGAMPLWLSHKLTAEKIFPMKFSKIGKIYELIRKEKINV